MSVDVICVSFWKYRKDLAYLVIKYFHYEPLFSVQFIVGWDLPLQYVYKQIMKWPSITTTLDSVYCLMCNMCFSHIFNMCLMMGYIWANTFSTLGSKHCPIQQHLLCTILCILNHLLILTVTHFGIHWCHLQGVES
jgi:hypothetical protein